MGNYSSPGVYGNEIDISQVVPTISTTTAAIVFRGNQGDVTKIQMMPNTQQFIQEYGTPVLGNPGHYSALAFLNNGTQLWCLRVQNGAKYGGVNIAYTGGTSAAIPTGFVTPNPPTYPTFSFTSGLDTLFQVYAKDPGTWNNNIAISIINVGPGSGAGATGTISDWEFDIVVYELINGTYTVVETWRNVSRVPQINGNGGAEYLCAVINGNSNYIYIADSTIASTTLPLASTITSTYPQGVPVAMAGGTNGSAVTDAQMGGVIGSGIGWDLFSNPEVVDIRILIGAGAGGSLGSGGAIVNPINQIDPGGSTTVATQEVILNIAQTRKDCIAIFDVPSTACATSATVTTWRNTTQNFNSSYASLYAPWVTVYDSYNAQLVTLPPSGYIGSALAANDQVAQTWYAPAGLNRGVLPVLSVKPIWAQGDRDLLYSNGINPIQNFTGEGIVIWGQKTEQYLASALDRVNVRRLLIILEKSISIGLKSFVFEPNNSDTWFRVTAMCNQYLSQLSAQGAFETSNGDPGYDVICDTTNNTPQSIDSEILNVSIFVKPIRCAEIIQLSVVITPTGATYTEAITATGA